jgi:type II secretory pathway pseudopilin PulG
MKGGKNRQPLGYTIVEVMIVLAVTGFMFVIAATFINGKQARTSFTEGTHEMASDIQDIIEQVSDGKYSDIPLYCSAGVSSLSISSLPPGTADCTFLGKFIHFPVENTASATKYEVFSLAGARNVGGGPPTSLAADLVTAITNPELTVQANIPQTLQVKDINVNGAPGVYGIGFIQSLGNVNSGTYVSGAQTVSMVYAPSLNGGDSSEAAAAATLSSLQPITAASICITDGTRYAQIILGSSNGNPLAAQVEVENTC